MLSEWFSSAPSYSRSGPPPEGAAAIAPAPRRAVRIRDCARPSELPLPALQAPPRRKGLWGWKGRGRNTARGGACAPLAAAMALPCSLNRYLLLMAQEHLEFRLPVSLRTPHNFRLRGRRGGWGAGGGSRAAVHAGVQGGVLVGHHASQPRGAGCA